MERWRERQAGGASWTGWSGWFGVPDGDALELRYLAFGDDCNEALGSLVSLMMLFDCETDPWNVTNLAADPAHAEMLRDLRGRLQQ